jgi:hypothetical protein
MTSQRSLSQAMTDDLNPIPPMIPPEIPPPGPVAAPVVPTGTIYVTEPLRWEHHVRVCDLEPNTLLSTEELNALGAEGWELAGAVTHMQRAYFYFKRCLP